MPDTQHVPPVSTDIHFDSWFSRLRLSLVSEVQLNGLLFLADNPASLWRPEPNMLPVLLPLDISMARTSQLSSLVGYRPWRIPTPRQSTDVYVLSEYSRHDHCFFFERSEFLIATSKKKKTVRLCVWMFD